MAVTMRDVANRAGVSPGVVSRVLHNGSSSIGVSKATAERVREAADALGYRCNILARNLRRNRTMSIGVLHGVGFDRPLFDAGSLYFAALMDGIVDGAFRHDYSVTLCPKLLSDTPEEGLQDGRFDGYVWYSTEAREENRKLLANTRQPLVLLHATSAQMGGDHASVRCDNAQGIGLAIDHLAELGHRDIFYAIEANPPNVESQVRASVFREHLSRQGLRLDENSVLSVNCIEDDLDRFLADGPSHTAVIANSDSMAAAIVEAAKRRGLRIPEDLSVVGFDSTGFCEEIRPRLTSISQPLHEMGARAVDLLVEEIEGNRDGAREIVFPCGLDVRESTSRPFRRRP